MSESNSPVLPPFFSMKMTLFLIVLNVFLLTPGCNRLNLTQEKINEIDQQVMVLIPEGNFIVGTDVDMDNTAFMSSERKEIHLDSFWMYKTEVTNKQYALFLNAVEYNPQSSEENLITVSNFQKIVFSNNWSVISGYEEKPVEDLSYEGAAAYCDWAGGRLPTNHEWEKAARGEDERIYPWGTNGNVGCEYSNSFGCGGVSVNVDSNRKGASPYGVLGMIGNVYEWTDGWFPVGEQRTRTIRGGDYGSPIVPVYLITGYFAPGIDFGSIGFRCVVDNSN